jgi:hypothetical protein
MMRRSLRICCVLSAVAGSATAGAQVVTGPVVSSPTVMGALPVGTVLLFDQKPTQTFTGWVPCGSVRLQPSGQSNAPPRQGEFYCLHKVQ